MRPIQPDAAGELPSGPEVHEEDDDVECSDDNNTGASMPYIEGCDQESPPPPSLPPLSSSAKRPRNAEEKLEVKARKMGLHQQADAHRAAIEEANNVLKRTVDEREKQIQRAAKEEIEYLDTRRRKRAANRSKHWATVKTRQIDKDGHLCCVLCGNWKSPRTGEQMTDESMRLDHTTALCLGGADDDDDNLQIICGCCDNEKTAEDMEKYRRRVR